ncbi:MAG: GntG family PLP-dependent aldolase [Actinocatenispora sp.]
MSLVDLRSDTVTRPNVGMRTAMAEAVVGDDVYGEDRTVADLEHEVAGLFGHEAALFVPSGIMGNQICLALLVERGDELLADADAHVVNFEAGAAAALAGVSTRTWPSQGGTLDPELVAGYIRPAGYPAIRTAAIAVENTHNMSGGTVLDLADLRRLREIADDAGVALHCDGARIWHAHVADGVPLTEYGALFETASVCLSKGLGAPVGSVIVSSAERIVRARVLRRRLGGAMRQVGILAAAGKYALSHNLARLADDHARAARLAAALAPFGVVDPSRVRTNLVPLDLRNAPLDAPSLAAAARGQDVLVSVLGPRTGRLVTHLDIDDLDIDRAIEVLTGLLGR